MITIFYHNSQQKHIHFVTHVVINLKGAMLVNCYRHSGAASPSRALWPPSSGRKRQSTAHTSRSSERVWDFTPTSRNPGGTSRGSDASEDKRRSLPAWQNPVGTQRHNIQYLYKLVWSILHLLVTSDQNPQKEAQKHDNSDSETVTCVKVFMQEPDPELRYGDKKLAWRCMCKWILTLSFLPNYCRPLNIYWCNYIHAHFRVGCIKNNVENLTLNLCMYVYKPFVVQHPSGGGFIW